MNQFFVKKYESQGQSMNRFVQLIFISLLFFISSCFAQNETRAIVKVETIQTKHVHDPNYLVPVPTFYLVFEEIKNSTGEGDTPPYQRVLKPGKHILLLDTDSLRNTEQGELLAYTYVLERVIAKEKEIYIGIAIQNNKITKMFQFN